MHKRMHEYFNPMHHTKIDKHVCSVDLQKASIPNSRIISDEYLKCLNDLKLLKSCENTEIYENYFKDPENKSKISFTDWLERKSQLSKMSKDLKKTAEKELKLKKKADEIQRMRKLEISEKLFKKWKKTKELQTHRTEQTKLKEKISEQQKIDEKKMNSKQVYKDWLKASLKDLKKVKSLEKLKKKRLEIEDQKNQEKVKQKNAKAKGAFRAWLKGKKKLEKEKTEAAKEPAPRKYPVMLAYTPNRNSCRSSYNIKDLPLRPATNNKIKVHQITFKDLQIKEINYSESEAIEELSSIRKSSKIQSHCNYSDEESLISVDSPELD